MKISRVRHHWARASRTRRSGALRRHRARRDPLPEEIPEEYQRVHANRAYRVLTDAMEILVGSLLFVRATQNHDGADGATVICRLDEKLYWRRLDRRGGRTTLKATNPRYSSIRVDPKKDRFSLVAIVCTLDE